MSLVFIIEDEPIMAECMALAAEGSTVYPASRHDPSIFTEQNSEDLERASRDVDHGSENLAEQAASSTLKPRTRIFNDALSAMEGLREEVPDVILLDILLTGPNGFTFLNELASYSDTMRIPVALVTSLDLSGHNLEHYGVFTILNKTTMTPEDISAAVSRGIELSSSRGSATPLASPALPVGAPATLPLAEAGAASYITGAAAEPVIHSDVQASSNSSSLPAPSAASSQNPSVAKAYSGLAKLQSSLSNLPDGPDNLGNSTNPGPSA